jgi:hypothetical protein
MIVPGSASPLLLSSAGGYNLTNSLRFRSSASAYLNRTGGTSTSRRIHTFSFWTKYSVTGGTKVIASAGSDDNNREWLGFSDNNFYYQVKDSGNFYELGTSQVLRDPSAWYHLMVAVDTTQATSSNRVKMYINGVQVTAFGTSTYPPQNDDLFFNDSNGGVSYICALRGFLGTFNYDGYLAEFNFIDGQQLTPSSFGQTSSTTGVWIPKKYSGTYGTNGFYLPFTNTASTSTLGNDFSGNSNTWTVNNISLTAGSTYDSMTDVPTLTSVTTANYCVLSPIASSPLISLTNGNLTAGGTDEASLIGTIGVNSGKWYWEVTVTSGSVTPYLGVGSNPYDKSGVGSNYLLAGISWYGNAIKKAYTGTSSTSATSNTTGVYGFALDISAGTLAYYFNNSLVFTDTTIPTSGVTLFPLNVHTNSGSNSWNPANFNFGQQPFSYTPPTGFLQLNTFNLPTPTIGATASTQANKYMDVTLWAGNSSTQSITNSGSMQPDCVWIKNRTGANNHARFDSVRGATLRLYETTLDEQTETNTLTSFNSNGFSLGSGAAVNASSNNYVGWQWRAGGTPAVTNTAGTITSTVSANTSAGFSIVTWSGSGAAGTIGHGLNAVPAMLITKKRTSSTDSNWVVWQKNLTGGNTVTDAYYMYLNGTGGQNASGGVFYKGTDITSTTFGFQSGNDNVNASGQNYVAYCFAEVAGYSAFGSYTGNGSATGDGPFIYTGFRPRFVMWKNSTQGSQWILLDTAINTYNVSNAYLEPNTSDTENTANTVFDMLSNGFKIRNTGGTDFNESANTYIYMAFAEYPFKYANAR